MATQLQKLVQALKSWNAPSAPQIPEQAQLGGMSGQAQTAIQSRPYQLYVQEQQAQGLPAVSMDQFMKGAR